MVLLQSLAHHHRIETCRSPWSASAAVSFDARVGVEFPKYPVEYSAGNYETFIGADDGPYCRELGTARLVIRYVRYESASRPVYLTPGNLECLPDIRIGVNGARRASLY